MAVTFSRLIMALRKDVPDIDELAEIISHDPFMTAKLLQLVNALRSDMSNRIYSVKQALVMLGMKKLKEWIYLLGLQNLAQGGPEERVKTALFRAFFAAPFRILYAKTPMLQMKCILWDLCRYW